MLNINSYDNKNTDNTPMNFAYYIHLTVSWYIKNIRTFYCTLYYILKIRLNVETTKMKYKLKKGYKPTNKKSTSIFNYM